MRKAQYAYSRHITGICLMLLISFCSSESAVSAGTQASTKSKEDHSIYAQIAEEGLTGTICNGNLEIIKMACSVPASDGEGKNWADDTSEMGVGKLFAYIDRQTKKILNLAGSADTSPDERAKAMYHLGLILRGLEEFYLQSNYLELKIQDSEAAGSLDPYNIEPINWTKTGKDPKSISNSGFRFGGFDKSSAKTAQGSKKVEKATYFSMAKELAFKETQRQWNTIERLIRVRYPQKATEIVIALKNASCAKNFKPDAEN